MVDPTIRRSNREASEKEGEASRQAAIKNASKVPFPMVDSSQTAAAEKSIHKQGAHRERGMVAGLSEAVTVSKRKESEATAKKVEATRAINKSKATILIQDINDDDAEVDPTRGCSVGGQGRPSPDLVHRSPQPRRITEGFTGKPALWQHQDFLANLDAEGWGDQMASTLSDGIPLCNMSRDWPDAICPAIGEGIIFTFSEINVVTFGIGAVVELDDLMGNYGISTSMLLKL